jgi:hypothetical protein
LPKLAIVFEKSSIQSKMVQINCETMDMSLSIVNYSFAYFLITENLNLYSTNVSNSFNSCGGQLTANFLDSFSSDLEQIQCVESFSPYKLTEKNRDGFVDRAKTDYEGSLIVFSKLISI